MYALYHPQLVAELNEQYHHLMKMFFFVHNLVHFSIEILSNSLIPYPSKRILFYSSFFLLQLSGCNLLLYYHSAYVNQPPFV